MSVDYSEREEYEIGVVWNHTGIYSFYGDARSEEGAYEELARLKKLFDPKEIGRYYILKITKRELPTE